MLPMAKTLYRKIFSSWAQYRAGLAHLSSGCLRLRKTRPDMVASRTVIPQ